VQRRRRAMVDVFPTIFRPASPRKELYSLFQIPRHNSPRNVYDDHQPASPQKELYSLFQIPRPNSPRNVYDHRQPLDRPPFIKSASVSAPVLAAPQPTQQMLPPSAIVHASSTTPLMGVEPRDLRFSDLRIEPDNVPRWRDSMPALEREFRANMESFQVGRMESMYRAVSEERERLHRETQRQQEDRSIAQREALVAMIQKREDEVGIALRVAHCILFIVLPNGDECVSCRAAAPGTRAPWFNVLLDSSSIASVFFRSRSGDCVRARISRLSVRVSRAPPGIWYMFLQHSCRVLLASIKRI